MGDPPDLDLGQGCSLWWTQWSPDRELNPQYAHLADVPRFGAIVKHPRGPKPLEKPDPFPDEPGLCWSGIHFDGPAAREIWPGHAVWKVEAWDPLTLSPSLLCLLCGWHVYIRAGKVVVC